jgi:hypothetical protein
MPRKPLHGSGVFRHELARILCQLEYFTKRHAIVSKQVFAGLRIRDMDAQIEQDRIRRTSPTGIEDDRDGVVIQDFSGNYDIAGIFRRDFEMRPADEFPPDFFRELLLDPVCCRSVRERWNGDRTPRTFIQLRAGQPIPASAQEKASKDDQFPHDNV